MITNTNIQHKRNERLCKSEASAQSEGEIYIYTLSEQQRTKIPKRRLADKYNMTIIGAAYYENKHLQTTKDKSAAMCKHAVIVYTTKDKSDIAALK